MSIFIGINLSIYLHMGRGFTHEMIGFCFVVFPHKLIHMMQNYKITQEYVTIF
jgi:hypothetical protein